MGNERHLRRGERRRRRLAVVTGLLAGGACGVAAVSLAAASTGVRAMPESELADIEVTHLPPLLTVDGEAVELRYDAYCLPTGDAPVDEPCAAIGSAFVRAGHSGPFRELPLVEDRSAAEERFRVDVPDDVARSRAGFSYYAVIRGVATGSSLVVPSSGADAPQRSLPLERPITVDLGAHRFGVTRRATSRVLEASWGSGPAEVGLEPGRNLAPIGGSSFDVTADGTVHVLDEANRRVLRWPPRSAAPVSTPLPLAGTMGDLAVGDDGMLHVLETAVGGASVLRAFTTRGETIGTVPVEAGTSQVREGPAGTSVVLERGSGLWRTATRDGRALEPSERAASGRPGRRARGGGEVVVLRRGNELRLALVDERGARRGWRVTSASSLAEVQLAEPFGNRLVVVTRVYTASSDEFVVLVLGEHGIVSRFAVDPADWAETAPLSRFRLEGTSLYQLGSSPRGLFVERFDLAERS